MFPSAAQHVRLCHLLLLKDSISRLELPACAENRSGPTPGGGCRRQRLRRSLECLWNPLGAHDRILSSSLRAARYLHHYVHVRSSVPSRDAKRRIRSRRIREFAVAADMSAQRKAIRNLPQYQRRMMEMYHTEGCSYEEIARVTGLSL